MCANPWPPPMKNEIPKKILQAADSAIPMALEVERTFKHCSVILRKGKVVSVGTNQHKTHPLAKKYGYRFEEVHAELDALLKYKGPKDNLVLVNCRVNKHGKFRMAKPCSICRLWCLSIFDEIYYSVPGGMRKLHPNTKESHV